MEPFGVVVDKPSADQIVNALEGEGISEVA